MHIENLLNIIDGKIVNSPKVEKIESATIYQSKVEMGDLFFACDKADIEKSVENGAYAVVFEGETPQITDSEIAYISVSSIKEATIKFLRYVLVQKKGQIFHFEDIEKSFLKQIAHRKNSIYTILSDNWQKSFETILNSNFDIFITTSQEDAKTLSPNYKTLKSLASGYIISDSLLKTTFKVDKYIYQNIDIAPFFVDNLRKVVKFCANNEIDYDLNRVKYTNEFRPIYIDKDINALPKGGSEKVLIFVNSTKVIDQAIAYLKLEGRWIKSLVLTPPKTKLENVDRPTWYNTTNEVKEILKNEHFHFAFCYKLDIEDIITNSKSYPALF
jgi:ferrochelatase